ncbi:hypothetical protein LTR17_017503 [Elasticomyces elasticus]|nr:hypothetical protein LTR17_017503 [Elasticomyces elasticus]
MVGFLRVFGYPAPNTPIGWNLSAEVQQLMGSLMTLGAMVASGLAGPLAWKLGRKPCLWAACLLCWASDIVMMATTSIGGLYAGRFLIGLANGLFMTFSQLLIYVIPFFIAIGLFFIPESPRWLSEKGQVEKARKSLSWLRPNQDAVDGELRTIQDAIEESQANSGEHMAK